MTALRVFVPRDAAAVSVGADEVAIALARAARRPASTSRSCAMASRGMLWLEPLVEIERAGVRYGFGPIEPDDVDEPRKGGLLRGPAAAVHHASP